LTRNITKKKLKKLGYFFLEINNADFTDKSDLLNVTSKIKLVINP